MARRVIRGRLGRVGALVHPADIRAGTEVPAGTGEDEDAIARAVMDLAKHLEEFAPHRSTGRILAVRSIHRDGHDAVLAFDDQGLSRVSRHLADDTDPRGLQPVPEVQCEAERLRARRRGDRRRARSARLGVPRLKPGTIDQNADSITSTWTPVIATTSNRIPSRGRRWASSHSTASSRIRRCLDGPTAAAGGP